MNGVGGPATLDGSLSDPSKTIQKARHIGYSGRAVPEFHRSSLYAGSVTPKPATAHLRVAIYRSPPGVSNREAGKTLTWLRNAAKTVNRKPLPRRPLRPRQIG